MNPSSLFHRKGMFHFLCQFHEECVKLTGAFSAWRHSLVSKTSACQDGEEMDAPGPGRSFSGIADSAICSTLLGVQRMMGRYDQYAVTTTNEEGAHLDWQCNAVPLGAQT
jgi:hypothetical protein